MESQAPQAQASQAPQSIPPPEKQFTLHPDLPVGTAPTEPDPTDLGQPQDPGFDPMASFRKPDGTLAIPQVAVDENGQAVVGPGKINPWAKRRKPRKTVYESFSDPELEPGEVICLGFRKLNGVDLGNAMDAAEEMMEKMENEKGSMEMPTPDFSGDVLDLSRRLIINLAYIERMQMGVHPTKRYDMLELIGLAQNYPNAFMGIQRFSRSFMPDSNPEELEKPQPTRQSDTSGQDSNKEQGTTSS